jgi:diaminohydroxyphosphoribosylaminopyrimidine deaminase/5-amino-6-(5-phosphoribosylamino)uracil reductase
VKSGMTLDGKIAGPHGGSVNAPIADDRWITSEESRAHAQSLRHESDAILVGAGTIVADDPLLTDRTGLPRRHPLLRVVLDSRLRCPLDSRLVKTAQDDVLVFCSFAEEKKRHAMEERGVRVEQMPLRSNSVANDGRPDLSLIAVRLGELGITSLLIEGGALVNWAALAAGVADKVFLYYAPKILAGSHSVPFASGEGFPRISDAAQIKNIVLHRFGGDFAVEGYLRDPYAARKVKI